MAQLGEFTQARKLLRRAAHEFGDGEPLARARCVVAHAEVALAQRDLSGAGLAEAITLLDARGDTANAVFARLVQVRRWILLGEIECAAAALDELAIAGAPPRLRALVQLAAMDLALKHLDYVSAERALVLARAAAVETRIGSLVSEVNKAAKQLEAPIARLFETEQQRTIALRELPEVWGSGKLVVDACRREARCGSEVVKLVTRPVLLELLVALAQAAPKAVLRDALIARVFGAVRVNDSHRARLRVEIGRLRKLLTPLATLRATAEGYEFIPHAGAGCCVLLPPADGEASALLALLHGGEAWATSALAVAVGKSQRAVQRALGALQLDGKVQATGGGRSRRWIAAPSAGFTTTLLLVAPGTLG
jgi:hypothetical protein